jgi:acetylornithine deacetylase/succinyl-diaminopimelate desuccinylase-like protein
VLRTGAGITQEAGATISVSGLSIFAGDTVTLTEANAHAADERLPLADLREATEVVALTLLDLLGGG